MKKWLSIFLLFRCLAGLAQATQPTDTLWITGLVKKERSFTLEQLYRWKTCDLGDINTSCSSRKKEISHQVKAVLLKQILDSVAFQYTNSHSLNAFYFKFVSADGYTVVYSFGELYNTETGNQMYLVTEKNGKPARETDTRILLLTTKDLKPGSRNMKWLRKIVVCKAD